MAGYLAVLARWRDCGCSLKSELSPLEDRGFILGVMVAPEGATMEYTDGYARIWEDIYKEVPEILTYFVVVAPGLERPNPVNFALSFVRLKPWGERERSSRSLARDRCRRCSAMPGVLAFPINPPSLGQNFRNPPVQFVVQGRPTRSSTSGSSRWSRARASPGLANVDSDLKLNKPQFSVDVDRDKAADVGVEVEAIGRTLETLLGGRQVTRFKREGKQYDVIVQARGQGPRAADRPHLDLRARRATGSWCSSPTWCRSRRPWRPRS